MRKALFVVLIDMGKVYHSNTTPNCPTDVDLELSGTYAIQGEAIAEIAEAFGIDVPRSLEDKYFFIDKVVSRPDFDSYSLPERYDILEAEIKEGNRLCIHFGMNVGEKHEAWEQESDYCGKYYVMWE